LEISDLFSPCVRALWFTQHPGIEISALNQVTFSLRTFSSSRCHGVNMWLWGFMFKIGKAWIGWEPRGEQDVLFKPLGFKGHLPWQTYFQTLQMDFSNHHLMCCWFLYLWMYPRCWFYFESYSQMEIPNQKKEKKRKKVNNICAKNLMYK